MITEDYVSFETAKLLEENGFNWDCKTVKFYPEPDYDQESPDGVYAPTIQTAMKWLREVHNIHIEVRITNHSFSSLIAVPRYYWIIFNAKEVKWMDESTAHKQISYETVEEACEAGIKYCLENLI